MAWRLRLLMVGFLFPFSVANAFAQSPAYPRVDVAATYEVDVAWPQKPAAYQWEAVPGIAVDPQDTPNAALV